MKNTLLLSLLTASALCANTLVVSSGIVEAHTEVFGDSSINPSTKSITSHLEMDKNIESLKGSVDIAINKLKSDNSSRDEHMVDAIESNKYPVAHYRFTKVTKSGSGYKIDGVLTFHGVQKPLQLDTHIVNTGKGIEIKGKGHFSLASYEIKPIKLLLLTVRDRIDLNIDVNFKIK